MKKSKLCIYEYTDFRKFLEDRTKELKEENPKYSRRYLVARLGLSSNNYLKRIIDGSRKLSDNLSRKLTKVLGLNKVESEFFLDLVQYGQAKSTEARAEALENLRRNRRFTKIHKLDLEQFDYITDPLTLALKEMVNFDNFQEDPAWISPQLTIKASAKQIKAGLEKLEQLGIIKRDEKGGLKSTAKHVATGDQLGNIPLRMYHRNMIEKSLESMELPADSRYFRGLTMSVPADAYEEIVEEYSMFIDRVRAIIDNGEDPDHVYHMEMGLFPLARPRSPKK